MGRHDMVSMKLKVEGAESELLDELESFLRKKVSKDLTRSGKVFQFPDSVKRSQVVDAARWFSSKKSKEIEFRRILSEEEIVLKKMGD